jgi:endonuclease-3
VPRVRLRTDAASVATLARLLGEAWPDATCEVAHQNAFQLLVGTILAAQSTDKMINTITPALFAKYPDARALAAADPAVVEQMIFSSGFYRAKTRSILGMARALVERHRGEVPRTMDELCALPGVARKTANVVLGTAFGIAAGVVVDTHVTRLAARLGLTRETDPVKIEDDLIRILPKAEWITFPNRLIWHGRRVCDAKAPACDRCTLAPHCPSARIP